MGHEARADEILTQYQWLSLCSWRILIPPNALADGRNNRGDPVTIARDEVVAKRITINGIPILSEWPTLDTYFSSRSLVAPTTL